MRNGLKSFRGRLALSVVRIRHAKLRRIRAGVPDAPRTWKDVTVSTLFFADEDVQRAKRSREVLLR